MDDYIDPSPKVERLIAIMDMVRKTADMNSAYLDQVVQTSSKPTNSASVSNE